MRHTLIAALFLGAALPTAAMAQDAGFNGEPTPADERREAVREQRREARAERAESARPVEVPSFSPPPPPPPPPVRSDPGPAPTSRSRESEPGGRGGGWQAERERAAADVAERRAERQADAARPTDVPVARPADNDGVASWRSERREAERRARRAEDDLAASPPMRVERTTAPPPVIATPIEQPWGRREPVAARPAPDTLRSDARASQWRQQWRRDKRYDWRRHRDRNRSLFRIGIYIDPFGWNYRRWDAGWQLPSRLYSTRYWIRDPYRYNLPPIDGPYRWVRYYDDVLLVDLRTGRVVDVVRGFFW